MTLIAVITAPQPIMTAMAARAGMPALAAVPDGVLDLLISSATEEIDGPTGWLGRSIGEQVLELRASEFPCGGIRLPLPPIGVVQSVTYSDQNGADVVVAPADYSLCDAVLLPAQSWPYGRNVRIRYGAGYAEVPSRIKVAVQLRVGELASQIGRDGTLKKEVVEGVGSFEFDLGISGARSVTSRAVESLLAGLQVWA